MSDSSNGESSLVKGLNEAMLNMPLGDQLVEAEYLEDIVQERLLKLTFTGGTVILCAKWKVTPNAA